MAKVRFRRALDAEDVIRKESAEQVLASAQAIASAIPDAVPVQSGTSRRLYQQNVRAGRAAKHAAEITGFPPHWHWLEYGTRWNPPYAPIRRAIERLGMRFVPS